MTMPTKSNHIIFFKYVETDVGDFFLSLGLFFFESCFIFLHVHNVFLAYISFAQQWKFCWQMEDHYKAFEIEKAKEWKEKKKMNAMTENLMFNWFLWHTWRTRFDPISNWLKLMKNFLNWVGIALVCGRFFFLFSF